jgi:hypothetical protein
MFRKMCDKDAVQLFFENLNHSTYPLKNSYHHISSVTVSTSNRHQGYRRCEIKSRIAIAKAAFNMKRALFTGKIDLELRKKLVKQKCQNERGAAISAEVARACA